MTKREPMDAGWLADKIGALGDYGQGAALKLRELSARVIELEAEVIRRDDRLETANTRGLGLRIITIDEAPADEATLASMTRDLATGELRILDAVRLTNIGTGK